MVGGGGFAALTWLTVMTVAEALTADPVLPPTDVEVICQNLNVHVRWRYVRAQSSFTVTLKGINGRSVEQPTVEHQYDLTPHIWSSEDMYMSNFYVTVAARVGGHQSEPASSGTFTFSRVETAAKICQLDFPPVDLLRKDLDATLSFSNPFHFYRELKQAVKTDTAFLSVTVTSGQGTTDFSCSVQEEVCKTVVVVPKGAELCVTLDGVLFAGNLVSHILFKRSERICAVEAATTPWIGLLLGIVLLAAVLTAAIVAAKRFSSNAPLAFPNATQWPLFRKLALLHATAPPEDICIVHPAPRDTNPPLRSSSGYQGSRASMCSEGEGSHQELAELGGSWEDGDKDSELGGSEEEEDGGKDSELGGSEEEDGDEDSELVPSVYDRPHCPRWPCPVDMGNGDFATGYKE